MNILGGIPLFDNFIFNPDGSCELSYISNTPELTVQSVAGLPMAVHSPERQMITSDNPFFKGAFHYCEADKGLWVLSVEIVPVKDIVLRPMYDKTKIAEYYFLAFAVYEHDFPFVEGITGTMTSTKCFFYTPGTEAATFLYTGLVNRFHSVAFTKSWVENNLVLSSEAKKMEILQFLDNETGFFNRIDITTAAEDLSAVIWQRLHAEQAPGSDRLWFAETLHTIIGHFFQSMLAENPFDSYSALFNNDYAKLAQVERKMLEGLMKPFAGVETLARAAGMSPTKLKTLFKSVFGFSMLQYHKEKNLLLSRQLVQRSTTQIKTIAAIAGYKTVNKFSAAYKKRFGVLPGAERTHKNVRLDC